MTLGLLLSVPVGVPCCDWFWDIADFGIPLALVRTLPPGEGGGLLVNRTRGEDGEVGEVTGM